MSGWIIGDRDGVWLVDFYCLGAKEPPTALLWCLYYLAQHYDYHRQLDKALATINKAIDHSPTVVELYMTKGRILKVQHNNTWME